MLDLQRHMNSQPALIPVPYLHVKFTAGTASGKQGGKDRQGQKTHLCSSDEVLDRAR